MSPIRQVVVGTGRILMVPNLPRLHAYVPDRHAPGMPCLMPGWYVASIASKLHNPNCVEWSVLALQPYSIQSLEEWRWAQEKYFDDEEDDYYVDLTGLRPWGRV